MGAAGAKAGKVTLGLLLCVVAGLLTASPAAAAPFKQVGCFAGSFPGPTESCKPVAEEKFGEEVQLGGVGGMAVNYTGNGGVPKGTVYAARFFPTGAASGTWVTMYFPREDGGLEFKEAWKVTEHPGPYERCGPLLGVDGEGKAKTPCEAGVTGGEAYVDLDVDQATGNVYVFNNEVFPVAGTDIITEYAPDGSKEITRFGELAPSSDTVAKSPEKLHSAFFSGSLAVNAAGWVYAFDEVRLGESYHRLAVFEPESPGDYEHYKYAGEVAGGLQGEGKRPTGPVADAAGNVYVGGDQELDRIEAYAPEAPGAYPHHSTPSCSFTAAKGGITATTVNPETGEVFFFSNKPKAARRLHRLSACEGGEFHEIESIEWKPEREDIWGLAFDPVREYSPGREAGVLYGGSRAPGVEAAGQSSLGYIFAPPGAEAPPKVLSESVTHVTASGALLHARIDPSSYDTHYVFQHETEVAYEANPPGERFAGASEAPVGGATLKGGTPPQDVAAVLGPLAAQTEYRYRAVATSNCAPAEPAKVCVVPGEAKAFRTFPPQAPGLPDRRAYELVSPAQKHGGQVLPADPRVHSCSFGSDCKPGQLYEHFPMQSAPGGDAIAYEGTPFSESGGALLVNEYVSHRDPKAGWQTTNPTPSLLEGASAQGYKVLSTDLGNAVLRQLTPTLSPEAPAKYTNLYTQPTANPLALTPLVSAEPPNRPPTGFGAFEIRYAGASADGARIFFEANDALTEEVPGIAPEAEDGGATKDNLYEWHEGRLALVNVLPGNAATKAGASFGETSAGAISEAGDRAFFSDEAGEVFVRIDGEETKKVEDPGKFLSASVDGTRVLLSDGCLYDVEEEECEDLTADQSSVHRGGFEGVAGQSEDLSHVYFLDSEVLDEVANEAGEEVKKGAHNLYAWDEGVTRFVAVLQAADNSGAGSGGGIADWAAAPSNRTAEASPSGRYLAFLSRARLTGYDNTGPCEEISGTNKFLQTPCPEAFVYDSAAGKLRCASCNPSGSAPLGWAVLRRIKGLDTYQPRYLTDSGRLYFDTEDSLSLADTNERVEDVYQWEPPAGAGEPEGDTCEEAEGCTELISAGTGVSDSNFLAMDETGKNVFFTSRDRLTQRDTDELIDLYDAREGGGIPSETETAEPQCQGEACQPPASAPNDPTPASSSFEGPGNVAEKEASKPAACRKGKVRRKGRCVAKKHHKRAGRHHRRANHNRGGAK